MSKILAKLFNLSNVPPNDVIESEENKLDVSTVRPHELSYTGGGGVPDILA